MTKASKLLSESEKNDVARALEEAERGTSGEIVPVVATCSGRYDRAEDIVGLLAAVLTLSAFWIAFQGIDITSAEWTSAYTLNIGLGSVLIIVLAGFALGAVLSTLFPELRLPFILRGEMEEEVEKGARDAFTRFRVRGTKEATGLLLYVSLYEHRVVVLGDDAIGSKLRSEDWNAVRDGIVERLRAKRPAEALRNGIEAAGKLLAQHFPIREDDVDEIRNAVHFVD